MSFTSSLKEVIYVNYIVNHYLFKVLYLEIIWNSGF